MNNDTCPDINCPYHERIDCAVREPLTGTGVDDVRYATYVGGLAVTTTLALNMPQKLAVSLSPVIGMGDVELYQDIFRNVEYYTCVLHVGDGPLSEVPTSRASEYEQFTTNADDAIKLHNEVVVMINAGTFEADR